MPVDLRMALPQLLPKAIAWADAQAAQVASSGRPLDDDGGQLARRAGVARQNVHGSRSSMLYQCRKTQSCERPRSKPGFWAQAWSAYLQQIVDFGYAAAPLEQDARAHEVTDL